MCLNAGLSLNNTHSNKDSNGWAVGTLGWGIAVTLGVYASQFSGAHINPAVTGLLSSGEIELTKAIEYIIGQCLGAFSLYYNLFTLSTSLDKDK